MFKRSIKTHTIRRLAGDILVGVLAALILWAVR